jgi:hypothetical protein
VFDGGISAGNHVLRGSGRVRRSVPRSSRSSRGLCETLLTTTGVVQAPGRGVSGGAAERGGDGSTCDEPEQSSGSEWLWPVEETGGLRRRTGHSSGASKACSANPVVVSQALDGGDESAARRVLVQITVASAAQSWGNAAIVVSASLSLTLPSTPARSTRLAGYCPGVGG